MTPIPRISIPGDIEPNMLQFHADQIESIARQLNECYNEYMNKGKAIHLDNDADQWQTFVNQLDSVKKGLMERVVKKIAGTRTYQNALEITKDCRKDYEKAANTILQRAIKFRADAAKVTEQFKSVQSRLESSSLSPADFAYRYQNNNSETSLTQKLEIIGEAMKSDIKAICKSHPLLEEQCRKVKDLFNQEKN